MNSTEKEGVRVFHIDIEELYDDIVVLKVRRRIDNLLDSERLQSLVLDFTRVKLAGSAGLSMLVQLKSECDQRGCRLELRGMTPHVREVLRITKLDQLFKIYDDAKPPLQGGIHACLA